MQNQSAETSGLSEMEEKSFLRPYRLLDLTDGRGLMCGKLLGDLGADVIKVEKPGGDPARAMRPVLSEYPRPRKGAFIGFPSIQASGGSR